MLLRIAWGLTLSLSLAGPGCASDPGTDPPPSCLVDDNDCDQVPAAEDCNDDDPQSTTKAIDGDCDGVLTDADCNDDDPNVGGRAEDPNCDGTIVDLWPKRFGGAQNDIGQAIATDSSGNVLVAGVFQETVDLEGGPLTSAGAGDIVVAKFSSTGVHQWSRRFGGAMGDNPTSIVADHLGNVLVTGSITGPVDFGGGPLPVTGTGVFIVKLDASGTHLWSKGFAFALGVTEAIHTDALGNVIVTGGMVGTVDFGGGPLTTSGGDIFLAKFDANGTHQWSKRFGSTADFNEIGFSIATDAAANVFLTGSFENTVSFGGSPLTATGGTDIFLAKFSATGAHVWSKNFTGSGGYWGEYGYSVATDLAGNVAFTGTFRGTATFGGPSFTAPTTWDTFLAKFDANGNHLWSKSRGTEGYNSCAVAITAAGHIVWLGNFWGSANFGSGPLSSAGAADGFVVKYDSGGTVLSSMRLGGSVDDVPQHVTTSPSGNTYVTGYFGGTADFDGTALTSAGGIDMFVLELPP